MLQACRVGHSLRQEVGMLERKISNAEDVTVEAPPALRPGLYRKLEDLVSSRDRLRAELEAFSSQKTRSDRRSNAEIDQAVESLRKLREVLREANPEDTRELLSAMISRIELQFDHRETVQDGRIKTTIPRGDGSSSTGSERGLANGPKKYTLDHKRGVNAPAIIPHSPAFPCVGVATTTREDRLGNDA